MSCAQAPSVEGHHGLWGRELVEDIFNTQVGSGHEIRHPFTTPTGKFSWAILPFLFTKKNELTKFIDYE